MNNNEKRFLLKLSRKSIKNFLETGEKIVPKPEEIKYKVLREKKACFVTLKQDNLLRGCVGHIESFQPLYKDVIDNSISAAFQDNRFEPLKSHELDKINIEISVLSPPEKISFSCKQDLLEQITVGIDGVVLKRGDSRAVYLPQVWSKFTNKEDFLDSLAEKAGLSKDAWKDKKMEFYKFSVIEFSD
ncbi:MAG: AmmeMemoRadiSam system protein A [Candidatus Magasanikbacteria bacterium]|nr:AmmeMemoRadiSam system protein A [Candidatus Magasanikbacteria bacterium]